MSSTARGRLFFVKVMPLLFSFVLPMALYLCTCCRSIFWMDSTEFMLVGTNLGISHPPGYPLLTLIVRTASLIPILSLPFRLNLVSALAAAGSCLVLFIIVRRLTHDSVTALITALLWGSSYELWQQATALEAYALQVLLVAAVLLGALVWSDTTIMSNSLNRRHAEMLCHKPPRPESGPPSTLASFLFACYGVGLTFANHLFVVWSLPALFVLIMGGPWRRLRTVHLLMALALFALGPLLYLYLCFRSADASSYWGGLATTRSFLEFLTGRVYRYRFLAGGAGYLTSQLRDLPVTAIKQFTICWLLIIPGLVVLSRRHREPGNQRQRLAPNHRLLMSLGLGSVMVAAATLFYNIPDKDGYLLPVWFSVAIILGCGLATLRRTRARTLFTLLTYSAVIAATILFYPQQNRSHLYGLADMSRAIISEVTRTAGSTGEKQPTRQGAVVFTDDYSIYMGLRWTPLHERSGAPLLVVSEHHLAFPWYLDQLERTLPVPLGCRRLAEHLWADENRFSDIAFGERAKATTQEIRHELWNNWIDLQPIYWIPRDFGEWPLPQWGNFSFELAGLTYVVHRAGDTIRHGVFTLSFPGPDRYRTDKFHDPATVDLCRRFAATVNRRGMIRFDQDDAAGAIADFSLSLSYYPDYPAALENKGLVFAVTNLPESARLYLERYLKLEPCSPEVPKVKQFLRALP